MDLKKGEEFESHYTLYRKSGSLAKEYISTFINNFSLLL